MMKKQYSTFLARVGMAVFCISMLSGVAPKEIAQQSFPSVVHLVMQDADGLGVGSGSGFIVEKGIVATNLHVIDEAYQGYAKFIGNVQKFPIISVVSIDKENDLALLEIANNTAPPLTLTDSNNVNVGEQVFAIGSPRGYAGTFSDGIVSALRRKHIQTTAPTSPGSSGGPLLNAQGEVIGIHVSSVRNAQNLNFSIPSNYLRDILSSPRSPVSLAEISGAGKTLVVGEKPAEIPAPRLKPVDPTPPARPDDPGDALGQYGLGAKYYFGGDAKQNHLEAVYWWRKAADQGLAQAQYNLGVMHEYGEAGVLNMVDAVEWYRKAAEQNHAVAQYKLGRMYYEGKGIERDSTEALRWWRMSAAQNNADAQFWIGHAYYEGPSDPYGLKKVVFIQQKRTSNQTRVKGVSAQNSEYYREALTWFRKAAEQGHAKAQYWMGYMYANGYGMDEKNYEEAVLWLRKAVAQGIIQAKRNLGDVYEDIADLYKNGESVEQDYVRAYKFYSLAIMLGNSNAKTHQNNMKKRMSSTQISEAEKLVMELK